jgi:hypothetical protein
MAILSGSNLKGYQRSESGKFRLKKRATAAFSAMPRRRRLRTLRKEPWLFGGV